MNSVPDFVEQALTLVDSDDFDSALAVFAEIRQAASAGDTAVLVAGINSPRANFWVREMLAEPLAEHGGRSVFFDRFQPAQFVQGRRT